MNYLKEILAFGELARINQFTNNEFRLWHELMNICYKLGFPKTFTVSNGVLAAKAGMTIRGLEVSRDSLTNRGLIKYCNYHDDKTARYEMISITTGETSDV